MIHTNANSAKWRQYRRRMTSSVFDIAYSTIGLAPINTAEHYLLAAHLGFPALKGDIRPTSDGKLVMCHDEGFTLDENGRITNFDELNNKPIRKMSYAECLAAEYDYSPETLGHYAHVASFDDFVYICKCTGTVVYITVRDQYIDEVVPEMLRIIRKYEMEEHAVINSYSMNTLLAVRALDETITLSQVQDHRSILTRTVVDRVATLGNAIVTMFSFPGDIHAFDTIADSAEAIEYAHSLGIPVHQAQVGTAEDRARLIAMGCSGFHETRPLLPYDRSDIAFRIGYDAETKTAEITGPLGIRIYDADITVDGKCISIRNIKRTGSVLAFDDGLPALWLNRLPHDLTVRSESGNGAEIRFENNSLMIGFSEDRDDAFDVAVRI